MMNKPVFMLAMTLLAVTVISSQAVAEARSTRIEVFALSMNYWDTQPGESLSEIVAHLLPNNPSKHTALQREIVELNPQAFINNDPNRLKANHRLRLPGYMAQPDSKIDDRSVTVESYSWGNIKRPK
jgi:Tfp pilus assembly protein FimV